MKKQVDHCLKYTIGVIVFFVFIGVLMSFNNITVMEVNNINYVKSIQTNYFADEYTSLTHLQNNIMSPVINSSYENVIANAVSSDMLFHGKLTGYGSNCDGCSGFSACSPYQDFKSGNIYYHDSSYGNVRIVAAGADIPCGSIIKINNISNSDEPLITVVMDRNSAIKNSNLDLLFVSEDEAIEFGMQSDIKFNILRWGW